MQQTVMRGLLHSGCGIYLSRDFPFHSDKCSCSSCSALSSSLYSPFRDFMAVKANGGSTQTGFGTGEMSAIPPTNN